MNKKYLLPFGDSLREFLNDSSVSKSDLRTIVRNRGIFVSEEEKGSYIPILVRIGITPLELIELNEKLKVKEANPKIQTQSVECESTSISLINAIPVGYDVREVAKKEFSNYKLLGSPSFKSINSDPNYIELSFSVEKYDYTQSWNKNTAQFDGKIKLKKEGDSLSLNISLSHTSEETKEVANKVTADLIRVLKSSGYIKSKANITKIKFSDFTNENRVKFMQDLSQKQLNNELYFKDTKDIGFCPDPSLDFPDEISWMQEKVSNLDIQGKELHSTFFIKNKELHKNIQIHRVEASYSFDFVGYSGTCVISFEFPDFLTKDDKNSELVIKVNGLRFNKNEAGISQGKIKEKLMEQLENSKLLLYRKFAKQGS